MIPNNIYFAARYSRKEELRKYAEELAELGVSVTSSWLKEEHSPTMQLKELADKDHVLLAQEDISDIIESDVLLFFAEDQNNQPPRGGRHVEFGYGLAIGLRIIVIGGRENIFHYLPMIKHYPDWKAFLKGEFEFNG